MAFGGIEIVLLRAICAQFFGAFRRQFKWEIGKRSFGRRLSRSGLHPRQFRRLRNGRAEAERDLLCGSGLHQLTQIFQQKSDSMLIDRCLGNDELSLFLANIPCGPAA